MNGAVYKRCGCTEIVRREDGTAWRRELGGACPRLRREGGGWSSTHGAWTYHSSRIVRGQRLQVKAGGFATKRQALDALSAVIESQRQGVQPVAATLTTGQYLHEWLQQKIEFGLRPTTVRSYQSHLDRHLVPALGSIRLRDLNTSDVEAALRRVTAASGEGEAGATTVRRVHATLSSALNSAKRKRLIPFNPAADVALPARSKAKVRPWQSVELGAFLDHAMSDRLGPLFELVAHTGLRRGEALGLRWEDVDLERGTLTIRQQLVQAKSAATCGCGTVHRGVTFGVPKTASGDARLVDMPGCYIDSLLHHQIAQHAEREALGEAYRDHGLVFAQEDGNPLQPDRVTKTFSRLAEAAGLRHVRLHDLRHGQASLLLALRGCRLLESVRCWGTAACR